LLGKCNIMSSQSPGNGNGGSSGGGGAGGGGGEDIPIIKLESKVNTDGSYMVSKLYN